MENSDVIATESFSYSWLTDGKPPFYDILLDDFRQNLPENCGENEKNFIFDIPSTKSPTALVHADEIFSDGHIMPVYVDRSKAEALRASTSVPSTPFTSYSSRTQFLEQKTQSKWIKSSKKILQKCFGFVKPLCKTIGGSRKSSRVDDLERKVCEVQSFSNSLEASPRPSATYSVVEWSDVKKIREKVDLCNGLKRVKSCSSSPLVSPRISSSYSSNICCDAESSIHEAILYCKRSIEK